MKSKSSLSSVLNASAFTLIELLVVVLIIGILAAVAVPQYKLAVLKSRYVQVMIFAKTAYDARQSYYLATGSTKARWEDLTIDLPGTIKANEPTWLYYKSFRCHLPDAAGSFVVCIYSSSQGGIRYGIAPEEERYCEVSTQWKEGNEVCKSLGGKLKSTNTVNDTHTYTLP